MRAGRKSGLRGIGSDRENGSDVQTVARKYGHISAQVTAFEWTMWRISSHLRRQRTGRPSFSGNGT